jgi:hypothetical protein
MASDRWRTSLCVSNQFGGLSVEWRDGNPIATNVWRGDNHATSPLEIFISALEEVVRIDGASVEEDTRAG